MPLWPPDSPDGSTNAPSTAGCCAATRWETRTAGRCGCTRPRLRRRARAPLPRRLHAARVHRHAPGLEQLARRLPDVGAGRHRRAVRPRRGAADDPGVRGRLDDLRRQPVRRLPGTGRYHSYLCEEVVPWVDARYRTLPDRDHRAIAGKSSGGLGAMVTSMLRPDLFGAFATHSGDALSEAQYIPHFLRAARDLRAYDGDVFSWWRDFRSRVAFTKEEDLRLLEILAVSACFSPGSDGTPLLPFDPVTGALRPEVWERWLRWDPVRMAPAHADALRSMRAIWIDAGTRDEWFLDLGALAFREAVERAGVPEETVRFELFEAGHIAIEYRHPQALAWLAHRLTP
ncbi:alpha/beta hydrolase-fold protein [Actinomadura yumaensis]|uniref:alpha/beta hydrolase-fold protein n=1 Tax=Actinomadura yumaensis TaxID=111807 RepID=UPI00361CE6EC